MQKATLSVLLVLAVLVPNLVPAAEEAQGKEPKMVVPEIIHNFGVVYEVGKLSHTFIVRNEGTGDLVIESVKPG